MSKSTGTTTSAALVAFHDIALMVAVFYAPIFWGQVAIAETSALGLVSASAGQTLIGTLVGLAFICALVARWLQGQPPARIPNALHLPAAALLTIALVTTLTSVNPHASWLELARLAIGVALFFLVANRATLPATRPGVIAAGFGCSVLMAGFVTLPGEAGLAVRLFAVVATIAGIGLLVTEREQKNPVLYWRNALILTAAIVVALYGWREKVTVARELHNPTWQIFSTFFNPNPLGGFFAMICPIALGAAIATRDFLRRMLWGFCALLLAVTLYPTYSKGAMLAWAVGITVFLILLARQSPKLRKPVGIIVTVGLCAALAIALALTMSASLRVRAANALDLQSASNMFRVLTWQGTLDMFQAHPWLGIGPAAFKYAFPKYAIAGYVEAAHENYLQMFAEMGVVGGLVFLWLLAAVFFTGKRAIDRFERVGDRAMAIGGISAVVALMAHSLLEYDWYIGAIQFSFWFILGMLAHFAHGQQAVVEAAPNPSPTPVRGRNRRQAETEPAPARTLPGKPFRWPRISGPNNFTSSFAWTILLILVVFLAWRVVIISGRNVFAQKALDLGDYYARSGQQYAGAMALDAYDRARQTDPTWAEAWERYGLLRGVQSGLDDGISTLETAASLSPTSYRPYEDMAQLYEEFRQWDQAARSYQQALLLFPNRTKAMRRLAEAYERAGDYENAQAAWQRLVDGETAPFNRYRALDAIDVDTNFAFAHYALGRELQRKTNNSSQEAARKHFARVLQIVADYFARAKATDEMLKAMGQSRETREEDMTQLGAKARWRMAESYTLTGDTEQAEQDRSQAFAAWDKVAQAVEAEEAQPK